MGVVAEMADRICVMLKGEIVETGTVYEVFETPLNAYTGALLAAVPRLGSMADKDEPERFPLVETADAPGLVEAQDAVSVGAVPA
jgi:glutathione transport system ATP-binding protein